MIVISNYQYAFTLFTPGMRQQFTGVPYAQITNAFSRIMWGSISDRMGREYTMTLAFALEGFLIFLMTQIAGNSIAFVILLPFVEVMSRRADC